MRIDVWFRAFNLGGAEQHITVDNVDQVRALVDQLADADAGSAVITHSDRPLWNEQGPDHELVVAVATDGRAALSYWDQDTSRHYSRGGSEPSGGWEDEDISPPADAWVQRSELEGALAEFLRSAQRPNTVQWQPDPLPLTF
ncbi:Imm1 family immunity protein [Saccharopolyspora phatthalungensis]|uniref:Immunity protein Imm1 n=1 Tax=Saccharopolyspora phatthalungensis TaxID=664693 RepID=A0A840QCD3_9PSEU|nr:Imm1 family immunity protein [Saccharopolyspora phatthalungensis]MBB5156105.1 hypothetical protein [Saccharopolyspora phatthalungensis]